MSDDVKHVSEGLTDVELFEDHPGSNPRGLPLPSPEKAEFVLGLLRGAGLQPPFGMDIDDALEVWALKLSTFETPTLQEAVNQWISEDTHAFPAVGELVSLAHRVQNRQRAIDAAAKNPIPGQLCIECEGTGWVEMPGDEIQGGGVCSFVRPCQSCRSEQYELWKGGHWKRSHTEIGGCKECRPSKTR